MNWMTSAKKRVYKSRKQRENEYRLNAKFKLPPTSFVASSQRMTSSAPSKVPDNKSSVSSKKDHDILMLSNLEREKKYLRARTSNKSSLIDINPRKKKSQQEDPLSKLELSPVGTPQHSQGKPSTTLSKQDECTSNTFQLSLSQEVSSVLLQQDETHHMQIDMHHSHTQRDDRVLLSPCASPILFINDGEKVFEPILSTTDNNSDHNNMSFSKFSTVISNTKQRQPPQIPPPTTTGVMTTAEAWDLFEGALSSSSRCNKPNHNHH